MSNVLKRELLTISQFGKLAGISRPNLIFYDEAGLLKPAQRGENNYRYYSYRQLNTAVMIFSLREIGVSIAEIKKYADAQSHENLRELFSKQISVVRRKIDSLEQIKESMERYLSGIAMLMQAELGDIAIETREAERILAGPEFIPSEYATDDDAYLEFFDYCRANHFAIVYPEGMIMSEQEYRKSEPELPKRVYAKSSKGNALIPAGMYVVAFQRGGYTLSNDLKRKVDDFLEQNDLGIDGDIYLEYPYNELAVNDPAEYITMLMLPVA